MRKARWLALGVVALVGMALVGSGCGTKEGQEAKPAKEAAKTKLPDVVAKALKAEFPKAEITKVAKEKEGGVTFYDIDFKDADEERAIDIGTDGAIFSVSLVIEAKEVPEAVMKAVQAALDGGKIEQIEKREVRREAKDLIVSPPFDKPKIQFEAELKKGDLEATVLVDDKGAVLEAPKWEKPEKE